MEKSGIFKNDFKERYYLVTLDLCLSLSLFLTIETTWKAYNLDIIIFVWIHLGTLIAIC